ncbi:hypothetical protein [Salsuginibacillus kocurii]|uniref:hypothetical protein n=1 Tax=Salsuginibacillus kocurii TaxID=427078 RepID=UPI0003675CBD|nr:hypothetical protein [Salsuginibacillus kocurii]
MGKDYKDPVSVHDLFSGKHLEIVTAALILSGKLDVYSIELFRTDPLVGVYLIGGFPSFPENNENGIEPLAKFMEDNPDMTVAELIQRFEENKKED